MRYEQKAELQDSNKQKMYEEKEKQQSVRLKKFDQELKEQFEEQANSMSKQKLIDFYVETMVDGEQ
jgi:hypothetical protein